MEKTDAGKRILEETDERKIREPEERRAREEAPEPTQTATSAGDAGDHEMGDQDQDLGLDPGHPKRQISEGATIEQPTAKRMTAPPSSGTPKRGGDSRSSQATAKARVQPERNKRSSEEAGLADRPTTAEFAIVEIWEPTIADNLEAQRLFDITSLEDSINSKLNAVGNMLEADKAAVRGIAESLYLFGYGRVDVAEVFSPPCIASQAQSMGLRPGFSIDFGYAQSKWREMGSQSR